MLKALIFVHRWVGIVICVIFLLWFPSGIGMMYWGMPGVTAADRLEHSPRLDPARVVLSPEEAAARHGIDAAPAQTRLNSFDGRPVYRFGGGRGGAHLVYADTGDEQLEVDEAMRGRLAASWTGQPRSAATVEFVEEPDQWTVQGAQRSQLPLYKYSWSNGENVYVHPDTGEIIQHTTRTKRLAAHVSAVPHWVYYTPLRKHQPVWLQFMIWTSGIGTIGAIIGVVVGVWMYSPRKKYRLAGAPTSIPYRGQKRWHTIIGLVFGIATATYAFSGMMSLNPFPQLSRRPEPRAPQQGQAPSGQQPQAGQPGQGQRGQQAQRGGRRGGGGGLAAALRGRVRPSDFAAAHPRDVLAKNSALDIRELQFTSFDGEPLYSATLADGTTRLVGLDGSPIDELDRDRIVGIVKRSAPEGSTVETSLLEQYDLYYLDRRRQRPLPVILAKMNDEDRTRYYVDPKTATIVGSYSSRNWVGRWLYTGLHSLNFPWLYNYRPLWDIVVITFMVGGTALCVTSLVLAWRVLGRKLARAATERVPNDVLAAES